MLRMEPASGEGEEQGKRAGTNVRLRQLLTQAGLDAIASDVAHRLQRLMLAELHHRVKTR